MVRNAFDPNTEELDEIYADGVGHVHGSMRSGGPGIASDTNITKNAFAHPLIRYQGKYGTFVLTGDLYLMPGSGSSPEMMLHIVCPVCSTPQSAHALMIKGSDKRIEFDNTRGVSVERFGCTWELPAAGSVAGALKFGLGLCPWRVVIENNFAKDA